MAAVEARLGGVKTGRREYSEMAQRLIASITTQRPPGETTCRVAPRRLTRDEHHLELWRRFVVVVVVSY